MAETTNVEARKDGQLVNYDENGNPVSYTFTCDTNYPDEKGKITDVGGKEVDNPGAREKEEDVITIAAYDGGYPEKEKEGQEK